GQDSRGNTLLVHNFEAKKFDVHTADYAKVREFEEAVRVVPTLHRLTVLKGPQILGTLTNPAPGNLPTVSVTAPISGTVWPVGTHQTVQWTSTSPAGVPLVALVEYSIDGGTTRITLGRDVTG